MKCMDGQRVKVKEGWPDKAPWEGAFWLKGGGSCHERQGTGREPFSWAFGWGGGGVALPAHHPCFPS